MPPVFDAWPSRSAAPLLLPGQIHVWQVDLDLVPCDLDRLSATLQPNEQQRAARFRFALHRNRFIARHGLLREILGSYLAEAAPALRFDYGPHGKPHLVGDRAAEELHFSLSHSGPVALTAVTRTAPVGIDVELARPNTDMLSLAARFFAAREVSVIQSLPAGRQVAACYACWTRKEAYIKALGVGLSLPLDSFAVSPELERAALLWDRNDPDAPRQWRFFSPLNGPDAYVAVAVRRQESALSYYRWESDQA